MTGEIDLIGNITAIGGVEAKLNGAKKAGITLALIPKENEQQLERIRREGKSPESDDFKVIMVDHVKEALKYVIQEKIDLIFITVELYIVYGQYRIIYRRS